MVTLLKMTLPIEQSKSELVEPLNSKFIGISSVGIGLNSKVHTCISVNLALSVRIKKVSMLDLMFNSKIQLFLYDF